MNDIDDINIDNLAKIEAILFIYGEPINIQNLARKINLKIDECKNLLDQYEKILKNDNKHALMLIKNEDTVQLVTKPQLNYLIENFVKEEFNEKLTSIALEVLTIIAYLGPISRINIDQIRGVNSSFILRNLLMRGLIERKVQKNSYLYYLSNQSLKHLGISQINELPNYENYRNLLEKYLFKENQEMN